MGSPSSSNAPALKLSADDDGSVPARLYIPLLILLAYAAFLVTGFGWLTGVLQPVPLYVVFALMLMTLQAVIGQTHTLPRFLYVFVTSGFAIVYAGEIVFNTAGNFTQSPWTYVIINTLLLIVFVVDAVNRQRGDGASSADVPALGSVYGRLATGFAGLAVLFYVAAFLLDLLGPENLPHALGISLGRPYVDVNLDKLLGLHLAPPLDQLLTLDLVIALAATAVSLLLFVIVGALTIPLDDSAQGQASLGFGALMARILGGSLHQVSMSLRLVLGPLVWLIPAFAIASFAQHITSYLNLAASLKSANLADLFNPFTSTSVANAPEGIYTLALGIVAILMTIASVVVVEHNLQVIRHTVRIFRDAGRVLMLTWAFFIYSLAMLNAVLVLVVPGGANEPFQVGAPGLIALLAGLIFSVVKTVRASPRPNGPPEEVRASAAARVDRK